MKALGITSMILAIIATLLPGVGPYLTVVCALLASMAWGPGLTYGAVAILLSIVNLVLLSPSLWLTVGLTRLPQVGGYLIAAQLAAGIVLFVHVLWSRSLRTNVGDPDEPRRRVEPSVGEFGAESNE